MRKIIGGHVYDTDTAHKIGEWDNGEYGSIYYVGQALYCTKAGRYFLHCEGGAGTQYAKYEGMDSYTCGELIEPASPDAAKKWAEARLSSSDYESEWGTPEDGVRSMTARVKEATYQAIRRKSIETGKTMGGVLDELVTAL